jgi:hypothetical protein
MKVVEFKSKRESPENSTAPIANPISRPAFDNLCFCAALYGMEKLAKGTYL